MKKLTLIVAILLVVSAGFATNDEKKVKSDIDHVTIPAAFR